MATKNIVPRADNEGQIGTATKKWAKVIATALTIGAADVTAAGVALIDDADAAAQIATLGAEAVANKSTSVPTDAASDAKYPSVKAVKDYADGLVAGLLDYRGAYSAAGNVYPAAGGSGTAGAVMKGDMWAISVAGTLGGVAIQVGDAIIAKIDTPAQTAGNWNTLNTNVSYVPEDQANKENTTLDTSTVKYPTNNLVKTKVDAKKTDNVSATDKVLGRVTAGAGAIEEIACTAAGRALIDDVDAAAQRATLGTALYSEGTWTPVLWGFTIVGAAPAVSGAYKRIGNLVFISGVISAGTGGNTSVACPGGANSGISGLPFSVVSGNAVICSDAAAVGLGSGAIGGTNIYPPAISARTVPILLSATYGV